MSKKIYCLLIALLMVLTVSCVSAAEDINDTVAAVDEQVEVQTAIDDVSLESNDNNVSLGSGDDADVLSAGTEDPNFNMKPSCSDYGDVSFWASTANDATGTVHVKFILLLPYGVEDTKVDEELTLKDGSVSWGGEGTFLPKGSYRVEATYSGDAKYKSVTIKTPETGPDAFNVPKMHLNINFTNLTVNEKGNIVAIGQLDNPSADGPYNMIFANLNTGKDTTQYKLFVGQNGIITYEGAPQLGGGLYKVNIRYVGTDQYFPTLSEDKYINISEIIIKNEKIELGVGDEIESGASLNPADAGNLTFTSSNETVVTVDANTGVITGVGMGDATVTVSFAGNDKYGPAVNKTITVTAVAPKTPTNISVNPAKLALNVGDSATVKATLTPADAGALNYTSSNPSAVTVDKNGKVVAVGEGEANITVSFAGNDEYAASQAVVTVSVKAMTATEIDASDVTAVYNDGKNLVVTLKDAKGNPISGAKITVDLNGKKTYTTDKNGQVTVSTKGLAPKAYTAKITFNGNTKYGKSTKNVKVTVKKATPKMTAKAKTFKTTTKTKKYIINLKNNVNKGIKKATVYLKVGGKTYKATTNSEGKATFKITKLTKKGTYKATITFKGNTYYNKVTKKATIKVKSVWKTVSKGSKAKTTVKKIQKALKKNGYYLEYNGHYLKVDGIYQKYAEMAVKQFQKAKGLKVTGKVDEKTAKKLKLI